MGVIDDDDDDDDGLMQAFFSLSLSSPTPPTRLTREPTVRERTIVKSKGRIHYSTTALTAMKKLRGNPL